MPTPSSTLAIEAKQLSKQYAATTVVDKLDLSVARGQCFGLLGPNGAGKTTTLRMLLGLTPPSSGRLTMLGLPVPAESHAVRANVGLVPQLDNLDPDFSVEENLMVYGSYFGMTASEVAAKLDELLDFVELRSKRKAKINTLSGGMQRRLTIARALVNDPELLILDEPTTGLDPQVRHLIWSRLRELQKRGKTLLLTTHYMEEAERLCDELVVIDAGKIIASGSPKKLVSQHVEPEVFEFAHMDKNSDDANAMQHRLRAINNEDSGKSFSKGEGNSSVRSEYSGTTLYVYTRNGQQLAETLMSDGIKNWLRRPANLEDVFLRLTQRDLRD